MGPYLGGSTVSKGTHTWSGSLSLRGGDSEGAPDGGGGEEGGGGGEGEEWGRGGGEDGGGCDKR